MNNMEPLANIPDNDLEQNLNKGIWALWENLEGCKASWQEENFEQKLPVDRCPAENDRAAIKEKRGTRSMSLKPLHLNYIENKIADHGQWPSIKYRGLFIGLQSPKWPRKPRPSKELSKKTKVKQTLLKTYMLYIRVLH